MASMSEEDTPAPLASADEQLPGAESAAAGAVRDRPGGRRGQAAARLDKAMKGARGLGAHAPRKALAVDDRAVRRAIRWGKAEDARAATLDEVMKQRREMRKLAGVEGGERVVFGVAPPDAQPATPGAAPAGSASKQLMIWSIVLAAVVIGVMVVVAVKLL